ncbi:hypothetical protein PFAG_01688 [Plasmodium falciparum Santa Lucia]|uniref:Uncharacterized protein n=5 Tax=Plasmodium falciparum TaxID=5833 RepID=W4J657_PLAFP|nr:hypothetical protein PFNF135_01864 [Plasmodium falciparum NF135/5.C10]ETW57082.1 hypothetical protein PFUGPA_00861 [Plasmodium falciparum Palo Alto/Uganda]ETW62403.1 hypothetical protein PFMC_01752 [Plasmodium falciparum CAMP/Malaysia]EUR73701.1 hypothetical protein PFBG_01763 [Plasmodium falciparum 7G8]EUT88226.1 hypothetical protein PFAG_01688 [Plasmodium falciparum Santa Lucia]
MFLCKMHKCLYRFIFYYNFSSSKMNYNLKCAHIKIICKEGVKGLHKKNRQKYKHFKYCVFLYFTYNITHIKKKKKSYIQYITIILNRRALIII